MKGTKPSVLLDRALKLFGKEGEKWAKGDERIERGMSDETGKEFPEGGYCAIGAMHHVNTRNEKRAIAYLAFAIKLDVNDLDDSNDDAVVNNNDNTKTKFADVRRWFSSAINLAKANNE